MWGKLLFVTNLAARFRVNPRIDTHDDDFHPTFVFSRVSFDSAHC